MTALARLRTLAATDPALAPMAVLQVAALEAAADPVWERGLPEFEGSRLAEGIPLLHGATLGVDATRTTQLLRRLASEVAEHAGVMLESAVSETVALQLIAASIVRDTPELRRLVDASGIELSFLATLGSVAAVPLLQAAGRRAAPILTRSDWGESYCPVCGVWPTLAELRGLERQRWLRCGRCGAGWPFRGQTCAFCGCSDHKELGYLAAETERDTRRAETCECCHSYLKTLATLGALQPDEVLLRDIDSIELDMAALQKGYGRPDRQAFALDIRLKSLESRNGSAPWHS